MSAMKKKDSNPAVLGIYVSASALDGVLVTSVDESARVVHRMVRQRQRKGEAVGSGDLEGMMPGLKSKEDSDFTIEIGDGSNSSQAPDSALMMEFGGVSSAAGNGNGSSDSSMLPFDTQLKQMVAECAQLGYPSPEIAFCTTPPDVAFVELTVSQAAMKSSNGNPFSRSDESGVPGRKTLLELLDKEYEKRYDRERVQFYPMSPRSGQARYLAVVPERRDSVTVSLDSLYKRWQDFSGSPHLVETETTLYASLLKRQPGVEDVSSAVVRVGSDDTLILFFDGHELRHYEHLRTLSSYDMPETICSRVMLQQDEQKIGGIDTLYVLAAHEDRLVEAFQKFYPDTAVVPLVEALPADRWGPNDVDEALSPTRLPALVAALRLLYPTTDEDGINLIPTVKRRRKPLISLTFSWHTHAALAILLAAIAFFGWQYWANATAIAEQRTLLEQDPVQLPEVSAEEVRATIDQLQATYQEHTRALQVLDSVLVGSDKWSRTLEHTSQLTSSIPQIWFRRWQPQGNGIRIEGYALNRGNVAALNRQLEGVIERLEYNETNNVRVYTFTLQAPIESEMPEVALYLREIAEGIEQEEVEDDIAPLLEADQPHEE